jgi:hypothetical protein
MSDDDLSVSVRAGFGQDRISEDLEESTRFSGNLAVVLFEFANSWMARTCEKSYAVSWSTGGIEFIYIYNVTDCGPGTWRRNIA